MSNARTFERRARAQPRNEAQLQYLCCSSDWHLRKRVHGIQVMYARPLHRTPQDARAMRVRC